jgi:hypothetical protein
MEKPVRHEMAGVPVDLSPRRDSVTEFEAFVEKSLPGGRSWTNGEA